jgi:hypothetical protein
MAMTHAEALRVLDEAPERIEMDGEMFERFVSLVETGALGVTAYNRDVYGDVLEVQVGGLRFGSAER